MIFNKNIIGLVSALLLACAHFSYVSSVAAWQQISDTVTQKDYKENSLVNGVKALEWKGKVETAKAGNDYLPVGNKVYTLEVSNPNPFVVKGQFFANSFSLHVVEFTERKPGVCLYLKAQNTTKEFPQPGEFFNALDPELMKDKTAVYSVTRNQPDEFLMDPFSSFTMRLFLQVKEDGYNVYHPPSVARRASEKTELRCKDSKIPAVSQQREASEGDKELNQKIKNSNIGLKCEEEAKKFRVNEHSNASLMEFCRLAKYNRCLVENLCENSTMECAYAKDYKKKACGEIYQANKTVPNFLEKYSCSPCL